MTAATPLPPTPVLITERLVLRPLTLADAPAIQRIFPQWTVVRRLHAAIPWPYPDDGALTNVMECLEARARGEKFYWAITLKDTPQALIGRIDLWPDDGEHQDMRGFWLDPDHQGYGLMTEAADRVTAFAFEDLGWPRLYLSNAEANRASHRIKEKQGARIIDRSPRQYMEGEGIGVTWVLERQSWLERKAGLPPSAALEV